MQQCESCGGGINHTERDLAFYKDIDVPAPRLCFQCRLTRRLAFYNRRSLYRRKCDLSGKSILSIVSPDKPFLVYDKDIWQSDHWSPLDYGRDFDFSRPFFEQFRELLEAVPMQSLTILGQNTNSEYTNDNLRLKDCYLVFDAEQCNDVMYSETLFNIKDSCDLLAGTDLELCYECVGCENCYELFFSRFCSNCSSSWFLSDCVGCKDCFGCINLAQKQYCIFNKQVSKSEYESFIANFDSSSFSAVQKAMSEALTFFMTQPVRAQRGVQNQESIGAYLSNTKNAYYCFNCRNVEDCSYCTDILMPAKNCMDVHIWGKGIQLAYNGAVIGDSCFNVICSYYVAGSCRDIAYSFYCIRGSSDLFGCSGLQKANYCILNKQYTKDEYFALRQKVVEHMKETGEFGQFFPPEISPFGYNETLAQLFFPLQKEEVSSRGWNWSDYHVPVNAANQLRSHELPDRLVDLTDDFTNIAIICEVTGRPYKLTKHELNFYRKHKLPVPRRHPDQRHLDRLAIRSPYNLWEKGCSQCSRELLANYAPERREELLCEECYRKHVHG